MLHEGAQQRGQLSNFPEQGSAFKLLMYGSSRQDSSIAIDSYPQHGNTQHGEKNPITIAKDTFETLGHTIPPSVGNCQTQSVYTDYRFANSISSSMHLSVARGTILAQRNPVLCCHDLGMVFSHLVFPSKFQTYWGWRELESQKAKIPG